MFLEVKCLTILVCTVLAVGILYLPSFFNTVQGQINMSNLTSSSMQNQTSAAAQNQTAPSTQNQTSAAAQNQTETSGQNQTMTTDAQALTRIDVEDMKENLMNVKQALAGGNPQDALTTITEIENKFLVLPNKPSFTQDIQKIKDSISKKDMSKALDDLTKVQTSLLKAETEGRKAQLANPQMMPALKIGDTQQQDDDDDDGDDGDDKEEDNGDNNNN